MNEKTTKQIEEMKKQTIGVEVEMNSITRANAAKLAADFFGTGRHEFTGRRNRESNTMLRSRPQSAARTPRI